MRRPQADTTKEPRSLRQCVAKCQERQHSSTDKHPHCLPAIGTQFRKADVESIVLLDTIIATAVTSKNPPPPPRPTNLRRHASPAYQQDPQQST